MPKTSLSVVVAVPAEVDAARIKLQAGLYQFWCTNEKVMAYCVQNALPALLLHDDWIAEEHESINRWAHDCLITCIHRHESQKEQRLFLDSHFYNVRIFFTRTIKYLRTIEVLLKKEGIREVVLFEDPCSLFFITVREYQRLLNPLLILRVLPRVSYPRLSPPFSWKNLVAVFFGGLVNCFSGVAVFLAKKRRKKIILMSGSLQHLQPILKHIQKMGHGRFSVIYGEPQFNFKIYQECWKRGMIFRILRTRKRFKNPFCDSSLFVGEKLIYRDRDLGPLLGKVFAHAENVGFLSPVFDWRQAEHFYKHFGIEAVVLDEDFALRRALAVMARLCGIRCTVISHGIPTIPVLWEEGMTPLEFYDSAVTLVNSEFEKTVYERMLFRSSHIRITGIPRYDRIRTLKTTALSRINESENGLKKILYCATYMHPYDFVATSIVSNMLGHHTYQENLEKSLQDLFAITKNRKDLLLWVKPHFHPLELWRQISETTKDCDRIRFLQPDADIFQLELEANLIITHPSSVICEAIMFEKPVVILTEDTHLVSPYTSRGVAVQAFGKEELERAVQTALYDAEYLKALSQKRREWGEYFTGKLDGGNTARAAKWILNGNGRL